MLCSFRRDSCPVRNRRPGRPDPLSWACGASYIPAAAKPRTRRKELPVRFLSGRKEGTAAPAEGPGRKETQRGWIPSPASLNLPGRRQPPFGAVASTRESSGGQRHAEHFLVVAHKNTA